MNTQDIQKLHEQVSATTLLSSTEKAEWLRLLPEMNDAQAAELSSILQSVPAVVRTPSVQQPIQPTISAPQLKTQEEEKDLPIGVQLLELEQKTKAAQTSSAVAKPPSVSIAPIMHPSQPVARSPVSPLVRQPAPPKPIPMSVSAPQPQVPLPRAALPTVQNPGDLAKLNVPFIRQADPQLVLNNLLHVIGSMANKYPVTELIGKIEESPLYQAYYTTGLEGLNSGFLASGAQLDLLSRDEFEAFTDFRREMERILS